MSGFWRRYPNPHSDHVFSEDTVECGVREKKGDGGGGGGTMLRTKRVIMKVGSSKVIYTTDRLLGSHLSHRKSTLYPDHLYSAAL